MFTEYTFTNEEGYELFIGLSENGHKVNYAYTWILDLPYILEQIEGQDYDTPDETNALFTHIKLDKLDSFMKQLGIWYVNAYTDKEFEELSNFGMGRSVEVIDDVDVV